MSFIPRSFRRREKKLFGDVRLILRIFFSAAAFSCNPVSCPLCQKQLRLFVTHMLNQSSVLRFTLSNSSIMNLPHPTMWPLFTILFSSYVCILPPPSSFLSFQPQLYQFYLHIIHLRASAGERERERESQPRPIPFPFPLSVSLFTYYCLFYRIQFFSPYVSSSSFTCSLIILLLLFFVFPLCFSSKSIQFCVRSILCKVPPLSNSLQQNSLCHVRVLLFVVGFQCTHLYSAFAQSMCLGQVLGFNQRLDNSLGFFLETSSTFCMFAFDSASKFFLCFSKLQSEIDSSTHFF